MSTNLWHALVVQLCFLVRHSVNTTHFSFLGLAAPSFLLRETTGHRLGAPSWKLTTVGQSHGSFLISFLSEIAVFHCLVADVLGISFFNYFTWEGKSSPHDSVLARSASTAVLVCLHFFPAHMVTAAECKIHNTGKDNKP